LAVALLVTAWEGYVRALGYEPATDDGPDLWAYWREQVEGVGSGQIIIAGDSRPLLDIHLATFEEVTGVRPIQLSIVGSHPLPVLESLADDEAFSGTVLVGVLPWLFFNPYGETKAREWIKRYGEWSPAQRFGFRAGAFLESRLAFLQQDDLALSRLVGRLPLGQRDGVVPPPPYLYDLDLDRQARIPRLVLSSPERLAVLKALWLRIFQRPAVPEPLTAEQFQELLERAWVELLGRVRRSADRIRERGGRVIFVRFPSSGALRQLEDEVTPRAQFWERVLTDTASPGVHFEDDPGLSGFACPEESHLSPDDAIVFTRRLARLLVDRSMLRPGVDRGEIVRANP
jgi:hypothetical protein